MSLSPPIHNFARSFDDADDTSASGTSPAQLNLQRLFEQSLSGAPASKKDAQKPDTPGPNSVGAPPKGKPRLLLMGQRRYVIASKPLRVRVC
jgi:Ras-related GTP-binding protein C/D